MFCFFRSAVRVKQFLFLLPPQPHIHIKKNRKPAKERNFLEFEPTSRALTRKWWFFLFYSFIFISLPPNVTTLSPRSSNSFSSKVSPAWIGLTLFLQHFQRRNSVWRTRARDSSSGKKNNNKTLCAPQMQATFGLWHTRDDESILFSAVCRAGCCCFITSYLFVGCGSSRELDNSGSNNNRQQKMHLRTKVPHTRAEGNLRGGICVNGAFKLDNNYQVPSWLTTIWLVYCCCWW